MNGRRRIGDAALHSVQDIDARDGNVLMAIAHPGRMHTGGSRSSRCYAERTCVKVFFTAMEDFDG